MNPTAQMMETMSIVFIMPILFGTAAYSFRALLNFLQQRRLINRQAELSFKLIDSYNGSPELLAKVDGLMDLSPGVLETPQSGLAHGRILTSTQAGVILACLGVAFLLLQSSVPEAAQGFAVFGAIFLAIGAGFLLSSVAAFLMARRWGLLPTPPTESDSDDVAF
jgi:hypothetical protein